jgi:hypothetical protein
MDQPRCVGACEMAFDEEGLRVDRELAVAALRNDGRHALSRFGLQRTARGDDGNAHYQSYLSSR